MDYLYTLLKCITAGAIIVAITILVNQIDPKYGGILAAAPVTTTLAFVFTRMETNDRITQYLVLGSIYFAIPSMVFLVTLYFLMNRFSFFPCLAMSYLVWLGVVVLIHHLIASGVV
jgi:uncharacterized membrane protein (GlpM family)